MQIKNLNFFLAHVAVMTLCHGMSAMVKLFEFA